MLESLAASAIWDFLKWAGLLLFPAVVKIGAMLLRVRMDWLDLLFLAALGGAFSVGAWVIQLQWGVPLVTVAWEVELGLIRGLRFHNHGPGPALNVTIEPIKGTEYQATLTESIPVLTRDQCSEIVIPRVLPIGNSPPVVENDIHSVLGYEWQPLIVQFEDAAKRVRRQSFEIKGSLEGAIQVRRKPR